MKKYFNIDFNDIQKYGHVSGGLNAKKWAAEQLRSAGIPVDDNCIVTSGQLDWTDQNGTRRFVWEELAFQEYCVHNFVAYSDKPQYRVCSKCGTRSDVQQAQIRHLEKSVLEGIIEEVNPQRKLVLDED